MAYKYKNRTEEVASAIQELRWSELHAIGVYLANVEIPDDYDAHFWCLILHDWSGDVMDAFEAKEPKE